MILRGSLAGVVTPAPQGRSFRERSRKYVTMSLQLRANLSEQLKRRNERDALTVRSVQTFLSRESLRISAPEFVDVHPRDFGEIDFVATRSPRAIPEKVADFLRDLV